MQKSYIILDDEQFTPADGAKLVTVTSGKLPTTVQELLSNQHNVIQDLDAFTNASNGHQNYQLQPGYAEQSQRQMRPGEGTIRRSWSGTRQLVTA